MNPSERNKSNARLVVGAAADARVLGLDRLPFTLGRGAERDLCLHDPLVSREHALIDRDADGYFIRDLGSRHGTFVNGIPIAGTQSRLRKGDKIVLGTSPEPIVFEETEDESTTRTLLTKLAQAGTARNDLETLSLFLQAAQSLNSHGALNDVLRTMVEYTVRLTQAERGFVFLGSTAAEFKLAYGRDGKGNDLTESPAISASIVRDAAESDQDFVLGDAGAEAMRAGRESILLNAIRSVAAIPLRGLNSGRLLGLLYLDSRTGTHDFTQVSREILHVIARQAATLLENLTMLEAEREAALLRKELEIAASIQRQIIPQTLPEFDGVKVAARTVPCTSVGGDFYDVIPVPDGFVAVVADVCGKGIPAALLASMVQGMLHSLITSGASLVDAITSVSRFVCLRAPKEKYLTLAVLRYTQIDGETAKVELVNGGHVPPMIVRANGAIEMIADGDMPVGLVNFASFHTIPCVLAKGDRIVLLTDGVSEAENPDGDQFGTESVAQLVTQTDPVASLFRGLTEFCAGAPPLDDQTVLTLEVV
jgi:sigma-B regulation protein RsbU (phosphoserine phosphatase)